MAVPQSRNHTVTNALASLRNFDASLAMRIFDFVGTEPCSALQQQIRALQQRIAVLEQQLAVFDPIVDEWVRVVEDDSTSEDTGSSRDDNLVCVLCRREMGRV